jgi:hypothetical protein
LALLSFGFWAGCVGTSANAGRAISVLFVPTGEHTAGSAAERTVREHLDERDDLELRSLSRLAALASQDEEVDDTAREEEAQRRLEQADDAFSRFDYQAATTQLGQALEILRPLATLASGRRRLAAIHLQLAMVLLVHGERDAALAEIATCTYLDPRCAPDPANHPPELVALFQDLSAEVPRGSLAVATDPPGARASLDGTDGGATPARFEELRPGHHYLTLTRDGFREEVHVVSIAAGSTTERSFSLTLGAPEERAAATMRELEARGVDAEPRWRAEAASLAAADVLVVLSLDASSLALGAFDARGERIGEVLTLPPDRAGDAASHLDTLMPPPSVPWFGQWYFWTPIALALAAGFGVAVWAVARTPPVRLSGGMVHDGW